MAPPDSGVAFDVDRRQPLPSVILSRVSGRGCDEDQLHVKGSKRNIARALAVYLARDLSGRKAKDLGEFFGGISGAAITMKYTQACQQLAKDRKLRRKVEGIKEKIFNI